MQDAQSPEVLPVNGDTASSNDIASSSLQDPAAVKSTSLLLPVEIWYRIILFMLPDLRPRPLMLGMKDDSRHYRFDSALATHQKDLLSLALCCKQLSVLALKALYSTPWIQTRETVNKFVQAICRSDHELLVPDSCEAASTIRALHVEGELTDADTVRDKTRFCLCDAHVLFSMADKVSFVSLEESDHRQCECYDDFGEGPRNHLFLHFLSSTTKGRPLGLRWIRNGPLTRLPLKEVTCYRPLSQLTTLELVNVLPAPELVAFLTGDSELAAEFPEVKKAISAGLSPNQKLERLRLSALPHEMLYDFEQYAAERALGNDDNDILEWGASETEIAYHSALYNLARQSFSLPNLRLLILEVPLERNQPPTKLLDQLVNRKQLKRLAQDCQQGETQSKESRRATVTLSSLFEASKRIGDSTDSNVTHGINIHPGHVDSEWRPRVDSRDAYWRAVQSSKHCLSTLWNRSRVEMGLEKTEIRVVIAKQTVQWWGSYTGPWLQREFYCQAESFARMGATIADNSMGKIDRHEASTDDAGVWTDPDVFSLVEAMPWLSYYQLDEYGCCVWTGELPRDNNPASISSAEGGATPRIVLPAMIKMDVQAQDEPGAKRPRRNPSRRARRGQEAEREGTASA